MFNTAGRISRTQINEIIVIETGTYNQMYARPYVTDLDPHTLQRMTNNIVETYQATGRVDSTSLVDVAGSFIKPMADPERQINIVSGWNERRLRFMMNVEYEWATGARTKEYITGYTNYSGWNPNTGSMDHSMVFFVNSVLSTRETMMSDPIRGTYVLETPVSSNQLITNPDFDGVFSPNRLIGIRPQDLFQNMNNTEWADFNPGLGTITDSRLEISPNGIFSSRSNQIPSKYMSNVIDSYVKANAQVTFGDNDDMVNRQAFSLSREKTTASNPFLHSLTMAKSYGSMGSFTLTELLRMDPSVESRITMSVSSPNQIQQVHHAGQTENWHNRDATTLAAASLSQSIPGLMSELLLTKVSIVSSNNFPDGQMRTSLPSARSFARNLDMTQNFSVFVDRLQREIISGITYGNQISYDLNITSDILGETYISLSLDGNPAVSYCNPSFADHLLPVVATSNKNRVDAITSDFNTLLQDIGANIDSPSINNQAQSIITSAI